MRILLFALLGLLALTLPSPAQVTVQLLLDQDQFLRDESVWVKVRIVNHSGQTLRLGEDSDWLTFGIENRDGHAVTKHGEVPIPGKLELESAMVADHKADLTPYFDLGTPGRYYVTATLHIKPWNQAVASKPKTFDIVRGTKLWEQEFGVPVKEGPPEVRKYALQQATYLRHLELYARVTDLPENRVFRVVQLGPLVSFGRPETQIDRESKLHVLFQTGARSFNYRVLDPEGEVLVRQSYDYTTTRPTLRTDDQGRITVTGGFRRINKDDWPPPAETNQLSQVTNQPSAMDVLHAAYQAQATNATNATKSPAEGKKRKKEKGSPE